MPAYPFPRLKQTVQRKRMYRIRMLHKAPILFFPQMYPYEHQTERYNTLQRLGYRKGMLRDKG